MNKVIEITIRNKVARIASSPIIVGKNKDYIVRFNFDEDWYKYDTKTARFSQDGEYQDIIFAGNECLMPALDGGKVVEVGVYAGDISTTTPAYLKVQKSIIDDDGVPADPTPDVYAQIMERFNAMEAPAAVLYTGQELTEAQKAQARDNIGVNESLGMTGATVGKVPVVKTVDENGAPTEWEAGELPSGAYTVNLTIGVDGSITADKTFAEIKAASDDGKVVNAKFEGTIVPLGHLTDSEAVFSLTNAYSDGVFTVDLTCTSDNVWSMSQNGFDAHTLGISGASVGQIVKIKTVDESGAPTGWEPADMPSGSGGGTDTSLGITGASAGQVPIVNSVDENGVPNGWVAGDFPSGGSGAEWTKLGDITVDKTAEFIPLSFASGIVTIDTSSENYAALPSSYQISCVIHTIDITSKTSPILGVLKPLNYDAGTFEFYNRDGVFQSSAAYDPAQYKISIMNVGAVVMENIPTDYKRYKCRVTTPVYSTYGIRSRWNCNGFEAMACGADSSVSMGGGAIVETELYRFPYNENYMYKRIRTAYGKFYGGGSGNESQSFELITSGAGKTKPQTNGAISFSPAHMIFVNGTRFELWGTNND